ncbi:MAG: ribose-phosphate pyrophosphokinase [Gemmatimonadetes bacterium]|nr:ribose-phosphate pyrophosphokinase [Gemmatimonadota bacterium]
MSPDVIAASDPMLLLSGTANPELAANIAAAMGDDRVDRRICDVTQRQFTDGELFVRINENVRGRDVFIIQSTNSPSDNIVQLLLLIDAAKRASAARVTAVIPYFGYGRADRKDQPRVSIAAKLMSNLIVAAGADRVLSIDLHQAQIQGFFDIPMDHLYAAPVFRNYLLSLRLDKVVWVASDVSGAKMARSYARRLGGDLAIIDKRRPRANEAEVLDIVGEVEGRDCVVPDDMIDTGGTVVSAIHCLKEKGARDIYVLATHAVLSGPAVDRLSALPVREILVTDTVEIPPEKKARIPTLKVLSVASLLAQAIENTHTSRSVSGLFN